MVNADDRSERLLTEMRSGSVEAFDHFYEYHASFVYQIALKMTRNRAEAEDLCHDVFVEVFRHPERFDSSRGSVQAWLAVKTKSRFIDRLRRKKRIVLGIDRNEAVQGEAPATEDLVTRKMEREQMLMALKLLPEAQRDAVYNKYFHFQTQEEIADAMQKPIGTVKSLIRYGLKNLRKQFSQKNGPSFGGDHRHEHKM
ncbi:MAG: RNA polymerase sigma factor [Tuberibacillus sp.]